MNLDQLILLLNQHQLRATYGAVAGVVGGSAIGLMEGRPACQEDSWVVAATTDGRSGSRRGWPTGYSDDQIQIDCLRQIMEGPGGFVDEPSILRERLGL
jgi:hypothetical protein